MDEHELQQQTQIVLDEITSAMRSFRKRLEWISDNQNICLTFPPGAAEEYLKFILDTMGNNGFY